MEKKSANVDCYKIKGDSSRARAWGKIKELKTVKASMFQTLQKINTYLLLLAVLLATPKWDM